MSNRRISVDPFYDFEDLVNALTPRGVTFWKEVIPETGFFIRLLEEYDTGYRPVFDSLPDVPGYIVQAYLDTLIRDHLPNREYGRLDLTEVVEVYLKEIGYEHVVENLQDGLYVLLKFTETGDTYAVRYSDYPYGV
jgi:hypothetical protein